MFCEGCRGPPANSPRDDRAVPSRGLRGNGGNLSCKDIQRPKSLKGLNWEDIKGGGIRSLGIPEGAERESWVEVRVDGGSDKTLSLHHPL